jgi:hypothetical protein
MSQTLEDEKARAGIRREEAEARKADADAAKSCEETKALRWEWRARIAKLVLYPFTFWKAAGTVATAVAPATAGLHQPAPPPAPEAQSIISATKADPFQQKNWLSERYRDTFRTLYHMVSGLYEELGSSANLESRLKQIESLLEKLRDENVATVNATVARGIEQGFKNEESKRHFDWKERRMSDTALPGEEVFKPTEVDIDTNRARLSIQQALREAVRLKQSGENSTAVKHRLYATAAHLLKLVQAESPNLYSSISTI